MLLLISSIFIATLQAQIPVASTYSTCAGAYRKCGGLGVDNRPYTGPRCCITGYVCTAISPQYSQCNPGSSSPQTPQTPINPTPPSNPNTQIVAPINPSNPQTPPVTPQQPPATPQYGQQPHYPQYYQPQYGQHGGFMPGLMDPQNLDCEFGQCRNRRITLTPGQGFQLNCQIARQCDGLDLTLNVGHDPTNWGSGVSEINDLNFDAAQNGVTIRINGIAGSLIEVNNVRCSQMGSCNNLKIITGFGVELWNMNVHCDQPGACNGCTINGESCAMISMMHGNNNGYLPYGYGYTNQAQQSQPRAPGTPIVPQQGAPQYPSHWVY